MRMRNKVRQIAAVLTCTAVVPACDGAKETDLGPLTQRVAALETTLAAAQTRIATLESEKADLEARIAELEPLGDAMQIDDAGDVVFSGVNVRINNGLGATRCIPGGGCNGKGNLIVGYDEAPSECAETPGTWCAGDYPGCTCQSIADPTSERTGSHNLIVGPGHRYTAAVGVVFGESNAIREWHAAVLNGQYNEVAAQDAVVVAGHSNRITDNGEGSVLLGGARNTAAHYYTTILVGLDHTTTTNSEVVPPL